MSVFSGTIVSLLQTPVPACWGRLNGLSLSLGQEVIHMRCTRCDGLAVPQAVGIAADGRVIFGWCRACLADSRCELVEVSAKGIRDLSLNFSPDRSDAEASKQQTRSSAAGVDQSIWIVGVVGFLMIAWGMTVTIAGLVVDPETRSRAGPLGNGSAPLLRVGGLATILLGLMFLTLAANRDRIFRRRVVRIVRWGGLIVSLIISSYAILSGGMARNPLPIGWAFCLPLILSAIAFIVDERERHASPPVKSWEFPVVSYAEPSHPERPKKRI